LEPTSQTLTPRSLGDLLSETFGIYGQQFRPLIGIAALLHVPVSLVAFAMGSGAASYWTEGVLRLLVGIVTYAAVAFAVGQHYLTGRVSVADCYSRVLWRVVSLAVLSLVLAVSAGLGAALFFLIVPFFVSLVYLVYWSMAVPAVVVEGMTTAGALRRSFRLVRGSWWRVLGVLVVLSLVMIGLGLMVTAPFAIASWLAPGGTTGLSDVIQLLGAVTVSAVVPPVFAIAGTLLYYDLRVRKEDYDMSELSRELGLVAAPAGR
jgi:hypothetical protein